MVIGMIVLLAAFMVLDRTISASGQIADRSEALQRGRQAMDLITRQLRSQVCVGNTAPIVSAHRHQHHLLRRPRATAPTPIKQRTLTYDTDDRHDHGVGRRRRRHLPRASPSPARPPARRCSPRSTRSWTAPPPRPIFRYYGYQTGTTDGTLVQLTAPLSAADLERVALIKVGFRSFAARPISNDKDSAVLEDDVYVRVAAPPTHTGSPECI